MSTFNPIGAEVLFAIDELYRHCCNHQVTDLHFEPTEKHFQLKCRIGVDLGPYLNIEQNLFKPILQRFKILSHLEIGEQFLPQDGQFLWYDVNKQNPIPCRISTCPTLYGEKIVIRLLKFHQLHHQWHQLGLSPSQRTCIEQYLHHPDGIILICGATGSGKTTTLYNLLNYLNDGKKSIVSIEDPIEIPFLGFTQIELLPAQGFGMQQCLRTVLRQDPDVIMIGEIRDEISAKLMLAAAQTGHLMLTTLHASNALASIQRLRHLTVSTHDLLEHLRLIIFQNKLTVDGKTQIHFEVLALTDEIKQQILERSNELPFLSC